MILARDSVTLDSMTVYSNFAAGCHCDLILFGGHLNEGEGTTACCAELGPGGLAWQTAALSHGHARAS